MAKRTSPENRLVRKQVLLTSGQNRWLKRRSVETGLAESEIIRDALDRVSGAGAPQTTWHDDLRALVGRIRDDGLARRVAENKARQGKAWRRRLEQTRKALED